MFSVILLYTVLFLSLFYTKTSQHAKGEYDTFTFLLGIFHLDTKNVINTCFQHV